MEAFDGENFKQSHYDEGCRDIAAQLIDENAYIDVKLINNKPFAFKLLILMQNTLILVSFCRRSS